MAINSSSLPHISLTFFMMVLTAGSVLIGGTGTFTILCATIRPSHNADPALSQPPLMLRKTVKPVKGEFALLATDVGLNRLSQLCPVSPTP
jgi:hypothetical protein